MLIRIKDFMFDINKVDVIDFYHPEYISETIVFSVGSTNHDISFENKDEFDEVKEFLLNLCPDISTDIGRDNFLLAVKQMAKLQGFKGDFVEKDNLKNPKQETDIKENYFKPKTDIKEQ